MNADAWERIHFFPKIKLPTDLSPWDWRADAALQLWINSAPAVEVITVKQLMNKRYPQFIDFDLPAIVRAKSAIVRLSTGCDADVVMHGSFGLHVTNKGLVYGRMWYGREIAVITLRCHDGHPGHFSSWRVQDEASMAAVRTRVLDGLGSGYWSPDLKLRAAYNTLSARL